MLELIIFIAFIIFLIAAVIFIIKKIFKIGIIILAVLLILVIVTGGSIIKDFSSLKNKITNSSTIVLLENNGEVITGFIDKNEVLPVDISSINQLYQKKSLGDIKNSNFKIFIIKTAALKNASINNKEVTNKQLVDFFINNKQISSITPGDIALDKRISGLDDKSALFAYVYKNGLSITSSPVYFFEKYKEGSIIVYPDSIFFKFTKLIPLSWIDGKLNILGEKIKETAAGTKEKIKEAIA